MTKKPLINNAPRLSLEKKRFVCWKTPYITIKIISQKMTLLIGYAATDLKVMVKDNGSLVDELVAIIRLRSNVFQSVPVAGRLSRKVS